jgi:hypothetical protein
MLMDERESMAALVGGSGVAVGMVEPAEDRMDD